MREKLFKIYWKLRAVIAPRLTHAQDLYEQTLKRQVTSYTRWLDLGCGHQVLPSWREAEEKELIATCKEIVGADFDLPSLQQHRSVSHLVRCDIKTLPFKNDYFNLITANMVVEHLDDPKRQFREISRVLKPGGVFLFHTPNANGYSTRLARLVPEGLKAKLIYLLDGREEDDVFETHYRANTQTQIAAVARATGLEVETMRLTVSDAVFAMAPPIAIPELLCLRLLMTEPFKRWRTNIITILTKSEVGA